MKIMPGANTMKDPTPEDVAPEEALDEEAPEEPNPEPNGLHVFRNVLLEIRDDADRKRCIEELKHLWNRHFYSQALNVLKIGNTPFLSESND